MLPVTSTLLLFIPFRDKVAGRSAIPVTSRLKGAMATLLRRTTRSSFALMWNGSSKAPFDFVPPFAVPLPRRAKREPSIERPLTEMSTPDALRESMREKSFDGPE